MLNRDSKLDGFTKIIVDDSMCYLGFDSSSKTVLPDGTLHGISYDGYETYYYLGKIVAEIYIGGIELYRCFCTESMKPEDILSKLDASSYERQNIDHRDERYYGFHCSKCESDGKYLRYNNPSF